MQTNSPSTNSKFALWLGRAIGILAILFLLFDGAVKIMQLPQAVEPTIGFGYAAWQVPVIGLLELACLALYMIPRSAILGAVLLTGYLGGALATQVRANADPFALIFPILFGMLVWGSLFLREGRLRAVLPLRH